MDSPLGRLDGSTLDVLVLGGGLSGTAAAAELARAGFSVALIESRDLGRGESGRGPRLLDGSLRTLSAGRWLGVRAALHERRALLRAAPTAVRLCPLLLPAPPSPRTARVLRLHDLLGRPRAGWPAPKALSEEDARTLFPGLLPGEGSGFELHYEAGVDDRRLALLTALEARRLGAVVLTRSELVSLEAAGTREARATIRDQITGELVRVQLGLLLNATGSWIDQVRRSLGAESPLPLLEEATTSHLFVASPADAGAIIEDPATGGLLLAAPTQGGFVLSGSTTAAGDEAERLATALESAFDGNEARHMTIAGPVGYPSRTRRRRIRGGWLHSDKAQGVPLVSFSASSLSMHRLAARSLLRALARQLGTPRGEGLRSSPRLPGGEIVSLAGEMAAARARGLTPVQARWLVQRHGSEWRRVHDAGSSSDAMGAGEVPLACELEWALLHEGVRTLADLLLRWRVPEIAGAHEAALVDHAEQLMAGRCGWNDARREREGVRWRRERQEVYRG